MCRRELNNVGKAAFLLLREPMPLHGRGVNPPSLGRILPPKCLKIQSPAGNLVSGQPRRKNCQCRLYCIRACLYAALHAALYAALHAALHAALYAWPKGCPKWFCIITILLHPLVYTPDTIVSNRDSTTDTGGNQVSVASIN